MNNIDYNEEYEKAMLEAYIDKPEVTPWYEMSFSRFNVNGVDNMQWVWSWWAFFGTWAFLLYRKQYIPAFVLFIISILISFIPFGGFIVAILSGGYSTYFVYQGYKDKKSKIEASISEVDRRVETMREIGGYNQWVIWVYVAFTTLLFLYVTTLVIALMPN